MVPQRAKALRLGVFDVIMSEEPIGRFKFVIDLLPEIPFDSQVFREMFVPSKGRLDYTALMGEDFRFGAAMGENEIVMLILDLIEGLVYRKFVLPPFLALVPPNAVNGDRPRNDYTGKAAVELNRVEIAKDLDIRIPLLNNCLVHPPETSRPVMVSPEYITSQPFVHGGEPFRDLTERTVVVPGESHTDIAEQNIIQNAGFRIDFLQGLFKEYTRSTVDIPDSAETAGYLMLFSV